MFLFFAPSSLTAAANAVQCIAEHCWLALNFSLDCGLALSLSLDLIPVDYRLQCSACIKIVCGFQACRLVWERAHCILLDWVGGSH